MYRIEDWLGENNKLGVDIWRNKYQHNGETFDEFLDRVTKSDDEVKNLILKRQFVFGGRIFANRGLVTDRKLTLSNCYVITPPDDNIESIFGEAATKLARTSSYGGGCGIDISNLRPKNMPVNNAAVTSSGAVSFMEIYNSTIGVIGQNGRRGALMISISINHPDVQDFITIKSNNNKITNANISIRVTDKFMKAVLNDEDFEQSFVCKDTGEKYSVVVKAKELFNKLCENNYNYAEPGILFWNTIENNNLLCKDKNFKYAGVNPCAEEPLPAGGSCLLGSLNLSEFVKNEDGVPKFNFEEFKSAVRIAVRTLNEVLDEGLMYHPLEEQRKSVRDWRQIGLGILGLADMLVKLGITYGSDLSIELCNRIGYTMMSTAIETSAKLAKKYGPYPKFNKKDILSSPFYNKYWDSTHELIEQYGLRNSQLLTIAPTGSSATMLGVSSGIEPIFANYYTRKTQSIHKKDVEYKLYTPIVKEYMQKHNLKDESELPEYFVTAHDINPLNRIRMQAVWQKHIDASISSTVNLPNSATIEDVENVYIEAWKAGLKGITVFRDGCSREGILTTENSKKESKLEETKNKAKPKNQLGRGDIICVNDDLLSMKRTIVNGCGKFYLHVDFDESTGEPLETFIDMGKGGGCERNLNFISRLISLALRAGVPLSEIIDQTESIRPCNAYTNRTRDKKDTSKGTSCPSAIGHALKELQEKINARCFVDDEIEEKDFVQDECSNCESCNLCKKESEVIKKELINITTCPKCGETLSHSGGCNVCPYCGYSKCE